MLDADNNDQDLELEGQAQQSGGKAKETVGRLEQEAERLTGDR